MRARLAGAGTWVRARAAAVRWPRVALWSGGVLGGVVAGLLLFLALADWNALRGPVARIASGMVGRDIAIRGDLDVDVFSFAPRVRVRDLVIGDPHWARRDRLAWAVDESPFAEIADAETRVELSSLFSGWTLRHVHVRGARLNLVRDGQGRANWSRDPRGPRKPLDLPLIRRFVIADSQILLTDARRRMELVAAIESDENVRQDGRAAFRLNGEGRLNNRPFSLVLTGGPLVNVRRDRPYPFKADMRAGPTRVRANGMLDRPFNFGAYEARLDVTGADLADLYTLIGLTLPNTPPYHLKGLLTRRERRYDIADISGRVGDSDLSGRLGVETARARPFIEADLRSNSLDFDDLAAVLGGSPDIEETVSDDQRVIAARLERQGRILPDARLDLDRVRNADARLTYRAARVVDAPLRLRAASLELRLERGVLTMDPLVLSLPRGAASGRVVIDARQDTPRVTLDMRLRDARLENLVPIENALSGVVHGRVRLTGLGANVRAAAASANGSVSFVVPSGEIRSAFAELTGVNVVRGLGLLLSGDQTRATIRCGAAEFAVRDGAATRRVFAFDTEDVFIVGEGAVDLGAERFDLALQGHPKEPRLIRVTAPIRIGGRWRAPEIGVDAAPALGQAGAAAALAGVLAPLAALLPFIDPGLAENADCRALLAGGRAAERAARAPTEG